MVKRYRETVYGCEESSWTEMQESEHGMWVYYSDYAALAERCERLEAAADKALKAMESIWSLKNRDDDYIYDEMGSELSGAYFWLRDAAKVDK